MKNRIVILGLALSLILSSFYLTQGTSATGSDSRFLSYSVDLDNQDLAFYWRNDTGKRFGNFVFLKDWLEDNGQELVFAVNGGMYNKDHSPQGLYIENGETLATLDTVQEGYGNFYLQPNGVFYMTKSNVAGVCQTKSFENNGQIKYATQSGPMLLVDGKVHSRLIKGSKNLHIRNGVGVLPNGNLLFVMSKEQINFYDLATYFKDQGCKNALYLDGFVSRTYLPSKDWIQTDGDFGVIIGVTNK